MSASIICRCSCGLNCIPPKDVGVLTTGPVNATLFGNGVVAEDQVQMESLAWALLQYDFVLIKRGH